jgi:S1-C subfamily serine protease
MGPVGTPSSVEPVQPDPAPVGRPLRRRALLVGVVGLAVVAALALWWVASAGPAPLTSADVDRAVQRGIEQEQQRERTVPPDGTVAYQTIGVVVNARGTVLTAFHVVDGAAQIQVEFADGTRTAAHVTTGRPEQDVAVLDVDQLPEIVVPAVMAGPPPVGDDVFAVGNPLGLRHSLTAGVVSATDRTIGTSRGPLQGLIQFDAAVNPGNSGGPLLNRAGQVVGIVTGLANPARQSFFVGIGFAVPIGTAAGGAGGPQQ